MPNTTDALRFLQEVFPDHGAHAIFAHSDPAHGMVTFRKLLNLDETRDCYWSVASFPDDGLTRRVLARALDVRALVIDDVGTKVKASAVRLALGDPTAVVESSAGNYQWVYRLARPVPVDAWAGFFAQAEALVGQKLEGKDAVHLFRLPLGVNTKAGRGNFAVRLFELNVGKYLDFPTPLVSAAGPGPSTASAGDGAADKLDLKKLSDLMSLIPNTLDQRDDWVEVGHGLKALCENDDEGFMVFDVWSQQHGSYDAGRTRAAWDSFGAGGLKSKGAGLKVRAEASDPDGFRVWKQGEAVEVFADEVDLSVVAAAAQTLNFEVDQEKSSVAIVEHLAGRLKCVGRDDWREFDEITGRWREWTGNHMMRRVLEMVSERKKKPLDAEVAKKLQSVKFIQGIAYAAALHRTVIAKVTDFDRSPLLLGVPSGVIDLKKGAPRAVRRGRAFEMVAKATWVDPAPAGTPHPLWSKFLAEFTQGDAALEEWIQVRAGYCLTGLMDEHIMPFYHGPGTNGKSVYLNALRSVWGEYGTQIEHRLLFEKQGGYHLAPLAVLAGVRLAIVTDVPKVASWDVHMVKMLTGDDAITANRMHQNPITFKSTAKVDVSGNDAPVVADMDEGLRRRLRLLPMTAKPKVLDKQLSRKLAAEWPAILSWALAGLDMYWGLGGFPASKVVDDATREYHHMLDPFQRWLDKGPVKDPTKGAKVSSTDLFKSWDAFRTEEGRYGIAPTNKSALVKKMEEKDFVFGSLDGYKVLRGYRLEKLDVSEVF